MSDELQTRLGYTFNRHNVLRNAITHSSFINENKLNVKESNERLEYLGDAVLELCISDLLYHRYGEMTEGELTSKRASIVCEESLARIARRLKLGNFLLLGQGEASNGGRDKNSILADALEAILGAIYLDSGRIEEVKHVVFKLFAPILDKDTIKNKDYKTKLQEFLQKKYRVPATYSIVHEEGPAHNKKFVAVAKHGDKILGKGEGHSKRVAEQAAAEQATILLKI